MTAASPDSDGHDEAAAPSGRSFVPKIIHQFWDSIEPPADVAERMASWPRLHPGWAYLRWSDESAESFIDSHFGAEAARLYRACVPATMRADMLRVAALWQIGGVYADADVLAIRSLEPLLTERATYITRILPRKPFILQMHTMISGPGTPLLRGAWKRLQSNINRSGNKPFERIRKKPLNHPSHLTGPDNLTRAWEALPENERPRLIDSEEAARFVEPTRDLSYVREEGTWKDFKKAQRVVDFERADRLAAGRTAVRPSI